MPHVQASARGIGKHVEDVILGWQLGGRHGALQPVAHGEGVIPRNRLLGIPGLERMSLFPDSLSSGLDQVKRVLLSHGVGKKGMKESRSLDRMGTKSPSFARAAVNSGRVWGKGSQAYLGLSACSGECLAGHQLGQQPQWIDKDIGE